jgi:hypothetical protein
MSKNEKSKEFRYVYSNAIGIQFNGQELYLTVGIRGDLGVDDGSFTEEVTVIMSPTAAKMLANTLSTLIASAEKTSGSVIPVDNNKSKEIQEAISRAEQTNSAAKTAQLKKPPKGS